jgi:hypothetical protein
MISKILAMEQNQRGNLNLTPRYPELEKENLPNTTSPSKLPDSLWKASSEVLNISPDNAQNNTEDMLKIAVDALGRYIGTLFHGTNTKALETIEKEGLTHSRRPYEDKIEEIYEKFQSTGIDTRHYLDNNSMFGCWRTCVDKTYLTHDPYGALMYALLSPEWLRLSSGLRNSSLSFRDATEQTIRQAFREKWKDVSKISTDAQSIVNEVEKFVLKECGEYAGAKPVLLAVDMNQYFEQSLGKSPSDFVLSIMREYNSNISPLSAPEDIMKTYNSSLDFIQRDTFNLGVEYIFKPSSLTQVSIEEI